MPSKQNVIVLMTMMMMMEAVPLECCWWFIYTVLKLSCHAMNYGSIEERAERKKNPLTHQELTNQMERYIHHLQYLHWLYDSLHRLSFGRKGKRSETATIKQNTNTLVIHSLTHSLKHQQRQRWSMHELDFGSIYV